MSFIDLKSVLQDWEYDPDRIAVRKILSNDGVERIQLRIEMGLLQMETDGRPDGSRPMGVASLLELHTERLAQYDRRNGTTIGFFLTPTESKELCDEVSQYYRRCVALFVLEDFDAATNDASHKLAVMNLCREYCQEKEDRLRLEGFRPYVLMMNARSRAYQALAEEEPVSALAHVNRGLLHIAALFDGPDQEEALGSLEEVRVLKELEKELAGEIPKDPIAVTRKALRDAIEHERFEEAARLHDQLQEGSSSMDHP